MTSNQRAPLFVLLIICFFAITYTSKRYFVKTQEVKARPFETAVRKLDVAKTKEWCDDQQSPHRIFVARVIDRFRPNIDELWRKRAPEEYKDKLITLGPLRLRVVPAYSGGEEFDRTIWSWGDTYAKLQKTQSESDDKLWIEVDLAAQHLLRNDRERLLGGKKFLPPDRAEHEFRPNKAVKRVGRKEFQVELDAGDFTGHERVLERYIEDAWRGMGYRVRVRWVKGLDAYRFVARTDSGRSITNHKEKTISIANYAPVRTLAHELGHVLGFDDHYYDVWHDKYCYYTQEYRRSDLMSDSSSGGVSKRHWELLDQAYPWKQTPEMQAFSYSYGAATKAEALSP